MEFRKHFDYDVEKASDEAAISFVGQESLTIQSMAEDADINVLMKRFGLTGTMPSNPRVPMFGDFTGITDYQDALNAVSAAYDGFMELPAKLRARFNNNPQELLEFVGNDANIEEARSLGLLKEKVDGQSSASSRSSGPSAEAGGAPGAVVQSGEVGSGGGSGAPGGGNAPARDTARKGR